MEFTPQHYPTITPEETMSKLDSILDSIIQGLEILAPMTGTDLDDKLLDFLQWLKGDTQARTVLMNTSCVGLDPKNPQSFPIDAEEQVNRWRETQGYSSSGGTAASIEWLKTITKIIEMWKLISSFVQKEDKEDKPALKGPIRAGTAEVEITDFKPIGRYQMSSEAPESVVGEEIPEELGGKVVYTETEEDTDN